MTTELMEFGTLTPSHAGGGATKPSRAGGGGECYRLTQYGLKANPTPDFSDLSQDMSVTLLFSSSGYGPHLIAQYEDVAQVCTTRRRIVTGAREIAPTFSGAEDRKNEVLHFHKHLLST